MPNNQLLVPLIGPYLSDLETPNPWERLRSGAEKLGMGHIWPYGTYIPMGDLAGRSWGIPGDSSGPRRLYSVPPGHFSGKYGVAAGNGTGSTPRIGYLPVATSALPGDLHGYPAAGRPPTHPAENRGEFNWSYSRLIGRPGADFRAPWHFTTRTKTSESQFTRRGGLGRLMISRVAYVTWEN